MALSRFVRRRYRALAVAAAVFVVAGALQLFDANPAASQVVTLTAWRAAEDPGLDPAAKVWAKAVPVQVQMSAQAGSYAAGGGSIPVIRARALNYNNNLYVRVEWDDPTQDESTIRVQDFSDAVAMEFPARSATSVPSVCMGQAGGGVNIWQWRADSQRGLVDPADAYTNSLVEFYPSKEDIFYTARAAGNPYADPKAGPAQTLIAQAFGTLSPAAAQDVKGKGVYANGKWAVVLTRPFGGADPDQATFSPGTRTDMAFAIWNGSEGDRNGRKSVSQFVSLSISGAELKGPAGTDKTPLIIAGVFLVALMGLGIGLGAYGYREGRRPA